MMMICLFICTVILSRIKGYIEQGGSSGTQHGARYSSGTFCLREERLSPSREGPYRWAWCFESNSDYVISIRSSNASSTDEIVE